jgi:hypothetical protein
MPNSENKKGVTEVQDPVIAEAEQQLTVDERAQIQNQYRKVDPKEGADSSSESDVSKGEGPSKGKGVDPRNWGAIDLAPDEFDIGTQEAALASYKVAKELIEKDMATKEPESPACKR